MGESVASTTHDLSQLSVSDNPPPPSQRLQPIDFSQLHLGTVGFTSGRECTSFDEFFVGNVTHQHLIKVDGNNFTVDDGPQRDLNDPRNAEFLESIKNYEIPEEFAEDGLHTIQVMRAREVPKYAVPKVVTDERFKESLKHLSF